MKRFTMPFYKISALFKNVRFKITAYMFIPVILLSFGLYIFVLSNVEQNKSYVKTNYLHTLQTIAQKSEYDIENIVNFIESYSNNPETIKLLSQPTPDASTAINIISKINNELCSRFPIVDSVLLYNKQSDLCVTSVDSFNSKTFFNDVYKYEDYSSNYWSKYNYFYSSISQHHSLSPSIATVNGQQKYIQPLVFLQINDVNIKNFLIVNISFEKIINNAYKNYDIEEKIIILNNSSGDIYDASTSSIENILNSKLYEYLLQNSSFDYTINSNKYFVVSFSNTNTISGYTYYSMVPYKTLYAIQIKSFLLLFILLCFLIIFTILITLKISNTIASPIENIIIHSRPHSKLKNESLFTTLNLSIDNIFKKTDNYNKLLPYMHEKYLIDFLNSNELSTEMQTRELLNSTLPFEFHYFSAVIVQLYPLASFYADYNSVETANIQTGFYTIVNELFSKELNSYILNSEKNTLYIIVNTDSPKDDFIKIQNILEQLNELLVQDLSHVALMYGTGSFYKDFDGLKMSHIEALDKFNSAPRTQPEIIIAPAKKRQNKNYISYKFENSFSNALTTYDYDTAISLFNDIIKKNENLGEHTLKNIYSQILYIITKISQQKNVNILDYKSINKILEKPISEIKNEILVLLTHFKANYDLQNPTVKNIIAYLLDNYQNCDLSLESISETFSISKTYVSSVLKSELGLTFKEYLTTIRIDEAKKLLSSTDIPILEIVTRTGFSNKQTFSRVFKSNTNMTALEYRKKNK